MATLHFPHTTFSLGLALLCIPLVASAAPCMQITLTGTQSGPAVYNGQAGAGTLIRYGDDANNCSTVMIQVDSGRGTNMRLSQTSVVPTQLNAILFTHMHGDHSEGLPDLLKHRWMWDKKNSKVDIVCSDDQKSSYGHTVSCQNYIKHIGDAFLKSGEIEQRRVEGGGENRAKGGLSDLTKVITFTPKEDIQVVWKSGDVVVRAIRSTHIPGHASYRIDTPAGSVVVGGDAANDTLTLPRKHSTSDQVERLAQGVDVIVHSTMHPVMGATRDSGMPAEVFNRQSGTTDLGAMASRAKAKYLMLTHLAPSIGATSQGAYKIPGGPLSEDDFRNAVKASGYTGTVIVGRDLTTLRIPEQK